VWHISTGVGSLQAGHQFAGGEDLDVKLVVGRLGHRLGKDLGGGVDGVEGLREARREPPFELRHRLGDGRLGDCRRSETEACGP
jgi:hypothetical protein